MGLLPYHSHHIIKQWGEDPIHYFLGEKHEEDYQTPPKLYDNQINSRLINRLVGEWTVYVEYPSDKEIPLKKFQQTKHINNKVNILGWKDPDISNKIVTFKKLYIHPISELHDKSCPNYSEIASRLKPFFDKFRPNLNFPHPEMRDEDYYPTIYLMYIDFSNQLNKMLEKYTPKIQESLCDSIKNSEGKNVWIAGRKHFNIEACKEDHLSVDHECIAMLYKTITETEKSSIILDPK